MNTRFCLLSTLPTSETEDLFAPGAFRRTLRGSQTSLSARNPIASQAGKLAAAREKASDCKSLEEEY
jgi:hypothetical protein